MADSRKGFFSGLTGFIAGLAGLLTALVGAGGLAVQQGWVGGGPGEGADSGGAAGGSAGGTTANVVPEFAVEPGSLTFQPVGSRDAEVRIRNTGMVPLTLEPPTLGGDDAERFEVEQGTCDAPLAPGRSCSLTVRFDPRPGSFTALLVLEAEKVAQAREVPVKGTGVLP